MPAPHPRSREPRPFGKKWTVKDLTGERFGILNVIGQYPVRHKNGNARWVVECDCGTVKIVRSCHLLRGSTISCGCSQRERTRLKFYTRATFLRAMVKRYRDHALRRGLDWSLTDEQFDALIQRPCFYCGIAPIQKNKTMRGNIGHFVYNGVDRLVNSRGYFPENCVACCGTCNIAKQDMDLHEFVKWAKRLGENMRHAFAD